MCRCHSTHAVELTEPSHEAGGLYPCVVVFEHLAKAATYCCRDVCMHGCMHGCMNGWMHACIHGCMDAWMDAWMDGCMDGSMDGCMDGWMHAWMHPSIAGPVSWYWKFKREGEVSGGCARLLQVHSASSSTCLCDVIVIPLHCGS